MAEYQAGKGTTALGIIGTSLGGLAVANQGVLGNLLGGILGGGNAHHDTGGDAAAATAAVMAGMVAGMANHTPRCGCNEYRSVDRYDLEKDLQISELKSQIALRDANIFSDQKDLAFYKEINGRLTAIEGEQARQAVRNQRTEDSFVVAANELAATKKELEGKIRMEAERRCCADNSIVNYVNATFYPKLVADVTAGTTTTAQTVYNPLPDCSCGC